MHCDEDLFRVFFERCKESVCHQYKRTLILLSVLDNIRKSVEFVVVKFMMLIRQKSCNTLFFKAFEKLVLRKTRNMQMLVSAHGKKNKVYTCLTCLFRHMDKRTRNICFACYT